MVEGCDQGGVEFGQRHGRLAGKGFKIGKGVVDQDNGSSERKAREEGNGGRSSVLPGRVTGELELAFRGQGRTVAGCAGEREELSERGMRQKAWAIALVPELWSPTTKARKSGRVCHAGRKMWPAVRRVWTRRSWTS